MFPPQRGINVDVAALSGICGSISIACWIVVFSPQIIENFRRGSADGLSIVFIIIWLAGDVFNILGAVLQGVLPTMIILAIYYTLADIVLLGQCFYYKGFILSDAPKEPEHEPSERTGLLNGQANGQNGHENDRSVSRLREHLVHVDGTHLSPATPLLDAPKPDAAVSPKKLMPTTTMQAIFFNVFTIVMVCAAGVFGWWISNHSHRHGSKHRDDLQPSDPEFDILGQIFGYFCAVLYLGSRVPQLLLNYRRKSTEGVSLLFFLFACIGNLTYVMSIFAYSPVCRDPDRCQGGEANSIYGRYILVNLSWLLGSFGTLVLDMAIFAQFFLYKKPAEDADEEIDQRSIESDDRGRSPGVRRT